MASVIFFTNRTISYIERNSKYAPADSTRRKHDLLAIGLNIDVRLLMAL